MDLDEEIDRLYGTPLDEFVRERDALAKRLTRDGDREAGARVKALRKPTVGAWALEALLSGGDSAALRETMEEERSLTSALADCAEAIASETGKSGPALRDRVRATLHAASVQEEAREELAAGRFVREREAVGLGPFDSELAATPDAPPAQPAPASPKRSRTATKQRAPAAKPQPERAPLPDPRIAEAERSLAEARDALTSAEADHAASLSRAESARESLQEAELAEREARRVVRELWREVAKQERKLERMRPKG
jgi:hypothetical protein